MKQTGVLYGDIGRASAKALESTADKRAKYPWDVLKIGERFLINADTVKLSTIKNYAIRVGKKSGKVFNVVFHEAEGGFPAIIEVAYIKNRDNKNVAEKQQESKQPVNWSQVKSVDK
jgi:sporulation protein YlmC with PRC-barrel domain